MTDNVLVAKPTPLDDALGARFQLPNICTVQSLLFVVLAGILLSIVFTLVISGLRNFDWQSFLLIAMFVLWVALISVAALCQLRPWLIRRGLMAGSMLSYALVLGVTLLLSLAAQAILVMAFNQMDGFDKWMVAQQVLIAAILGGVSLRYLYLQEQLHIQQRAELASRIQALQSRIRPHFLFNSMNIIASLIETEPKLAEQVVEDLSELFRATLSSANQLVPVQQEVDLAKNYLHIESLRLGERLRMRWDIDPEIISAAGGAILLPHLSLQPLLENAIYHGIQPMAEGGEVSIRLRKQDDKIDVTVRNPVESVESVKTRTQSKKGNNLALENLQRRLQAYYGGQSRFSAGLTEDGFFEVNFVCPLRSAEAEKT